MALPSMTRSTGRSNGFADSAVLPILFTGELPSNRPLIPSIMERSASAAARVKISQLTASPTSSHPDYEMDGQSSRRDGQDRYSLAPL